MHRWFGCVGNQLVAFGIALVLLGVGAASAAAWASHATWTPTSVSILAGATATALALSWALGRALARPLEDLHRQLAVLVAAPRFGNRVELARSDELGDVANAFNTLLARLDARAQEHHAFVADLAHELKTPIATVRTMAEQLAGGGSPESVVLAARVLDESGRRLQSLVNQFLELARAEAGLPSEAREQVDLAKLLRGVIAAAVSPAFPGIRFDLRAADGLMLPVEGVASRLEIAFRNLLENAASFSPSKGAVRMTLERSASVATLVIEDEGPGIAPADLPYVFDRFFTTRAGQGGTGLGLAMSRAVVEAHGGTVRAVEPRAVGGAAFRIELPLARLPAEAESGADLGDARSRFDEDAGDPRFQLHDRPRREMKREPH